MNITNFNLCKSEWLELVFADRNKEYGAYYIRQHYADNVVKAMLITFFGVTALAVVTGISIRTKPATEGMVVFKTDQIFVAPPEKPKVKPPQPKVVEAKPVAPKAASPINVIKFVPPVVVDQPVVEELPKLEQLKGSAVGQTDIKGDTPGANSDAGTKEGTGTGVGTGDNPTGNSTLLIAEVMPQPIGGEATWSKFLQNNLRYPRKAIDNGISGKVFVSFIVEKDGHLSNIKVERGPGYGMDEEAARVLKIAKAWKPGMQNGQPVRVQLTLPVNFSLGDQ